VNEFPKRGLKALKQFVPLGFGNAAKLRAPCGTLDAFTVGTEAGLDVDADQGQDGMRAGRDLRAN
jgi:hypothetical protein